MRSVVNAAKNLQSIHIFWLQNSAVSKSTFFLTLAGLCLQQLPQTQKHHVFVLACLALPSCARVLPQELCHWFCSNNLWLSSGIAFESDCHTICQMASRNNLCGVWVLFRSVEDAKLVASKFSNPHPPDWCLVMSTEWGVFCQVDCAQIICHRKAQSHSFHPSHKGVKATWDGITGHHHSSLLSD